MRVTLGSKAHAQQLAAPGGWVLLPRSLSAQYGRLSLWYRRCVAGEPPLRHLSFVLPAVAAQLEPPEFARTKDGVRLHVSPVNVRVGGRAKRLSWSTPSRCYLAWGCEPS